MRNLRSECTPCKLYPISPSIKLGFKNKLRKVSCLRWGVRPNLASIALSYSFESYCPGLCRRRHYKQSHIEQQSILIRLSIRYLKQNSTPHFKLGTDILFALYMCVRMLYALYMCARIAFIAGFLLRCQVQIGTTHSESIHIVLTNCQVSLFVCF